MPLTIKQHAKWDLIALGEVMLRFDPGEQRIARARTFHVWEGGGEYNVARGLRRCFGRPTSIVTTLVDNPVGRLLEDLMLEGGVDLSHLRWVDPPLGSDVRNGTYFLERGHGIRAALGTMDRKHTAISRLRAGEVDWDAIFSASDEGTRWFHTGGILCALSDDSPQLAREAMQAAQRHGTIVSFDCNYRPSLWAGRGGRARAIEINRSLMPYVDVLFGHEGDLATTEASARPPWHDGDSFRAMSKRLLADFPNIQVVASSMRRVATATRNDWSGLAFADGVACRGIEFAGMDILDRVGGGDAFAAGVIHGLLGGKGLQWAIDCGVAHGALAMTTPGDSSMATAAEVERVMAGASAGVAR